MPDLWKDMETQQPRFAAFTSSETASHVAYPILSLLPTWTYTLHKQILNDKQSFLIDASPVIMICDP